MTKAMIDLFNDHGCKATESVALGEDKHLMQNCSVALSRLFIDF